MTIEIDVRQSAPYGASARVVVEFSRGLEEQALNALDAAYKEAHDRINYEDR